MYFSFFFAGEQCFFCYNQSHSHPKPINRNLSRGRPYFSCSDFILTNHISSISLININGIISILDLFCKHVKLYPTICVLYPIKTENIEKSYWNKFMCFAKWQCIKPCQLILIKHSGGVYQYSVYFITLFILIILYNFQYTCAQ